MPEPATQPVQLLPTVSIVEETMRLAHRAVALALTGAALMAAVLLGEQLWSSAAMERAADRHAMAHKLAGDVRLADQQLALAAQMAAMTGDAAWVERYDKLLPELAQTMDHASLLAPPDAAQHYQSSTRETAALLLRMQRSALEAVGTGASASARALFDSPRYVTQTKLLRQATEDLTTASLKATEDEVHGLRRLSTGLHRSRGSLLDAEERIQRLAASDLLTGLDNRAALHDATHTVMNRARRHDEELAVLMVDLTSAPAIPA